MYFLDELEDFRLYRRTVLLPLNEKDKRHTGLAYILSPNLKGTENILTLNSLLIARYYESFYTERAVLYYINQENNIECFDPDEYITEKADLFEPSDMKISFSGYDHNVREAKRYLTDKWFSKQFDTFRANKSKIGQINIIIKEALEGSTADTIYLVPHNRFPSEFKTYENYCHYSAYMWLFYNINPEINDWLCMACALKESGAASLYQKHNWPFHYNLGVICRSLDRYESEHSRVAYINDIIRGYNGLSKINVSVSDLLSLLARDLQKDLKMYFENSIPISENTGIILEDIDTILEDKKYNSAFKQTLMKDRIKTTKELKELYDGIKERVPGIKYTYNEISLYNKLNLFVDLSYYNDSFLKNTNLTKIRGARAYLDLLKRLINDQRFIDAGYTKQSIIIPMSAWHNYYQDTNTIHLVGKTINPISCIFYVLNSTTSGMNLKDIFGDREVLFLGDTSFMKINFSKINKSNDKLFLRNIRTILNKGLVLDKEAMRGSEPVSSARALKMQVVDKIERTQKIKIDNLSADEEDKPTDTEEEKKKKELVKVIDKNTKNQETEDQALDNLDNNEEDAKRMKQILSDLQTNPDNRGSNISGARASRMLKLQNDFLDSKFEGESIRDIIDPNSPNYESEKEVKPTSLDVDSINPEWKELSFQSTLESYDLDDDIVRIFGSFYNKSNPLVVRSIEKEDTSTSEDLIETYTCKYESAQGERFTVKLDIPKFIDNKYMILRGNRKNIPIQLFLMPIIKTEENAVQIVSCYNKIFVRRFGTNSGKSNPVTDKLMKALNKQEYKHIKVIVGDNTKVCSKYELPIDYIDLASSYSRIETPRYVFMFNQDEIHKKLNVDDKKGLCIGYYKQNKEPLYYSQNPDNPYFLSAFIQTLITESLPTTDKEDFLDNYNNAATAVRYCYSRASMLGVHIPTIVVCGLAEGLESTLRKAHIKYELSEKRPTIDRTVKDIIRFKDGYLTYDLNYASCLLMNGLKQCNTEDYSITEINSRTMYLDFLDMFGGRIKADGLDNFQDCMIDPITRDTLQHYKLPTDYVEVLLYANLLLSDNKFVKHGDIRSTRRLRRMEQVASYMYEVMSSTYGAYSTGLKHGRKVGFSCKQSAVIDKLLVGNTTDDQSILNALGEYEAYNAVTPKGPSGMNSDRAYSLDKRSFDPSMVNVLSASTGFSGNVGITRQATIDANVEGTRGYIYNDPDTSKDEINSVKSLCMTESLSPFSSTRDDPMRLAMGFIQTSKHNMRSVHGDPSLISTGADQALPYLISNTFAYKSKGKGHVIEVVPDQYMIIEYDEPIKGQNKVREYIDLSESVQKNSSSGFYVTLKLDTDLKEGQKFKANQILAYDKSSFNDEVGYDDNVAYDIGTLAKFAILNTDEGFEDSAIVSSSLSEAMASDVVMEKEITIPKDASVYNLVKKGQAINEGDTLMILQNSYDEEDVNTLLRNLAGSEEEITDLGRIPITSKVTGVVQDIIIERTVELDELSPSLKKIVSLYEKEIKSKKAVMSKYGIEDVNKILPDTKALPATGKLKNASDAIVIRIYLAYHDKFKQGDKLIYGVAVKGVDKELFPEGLEPYSEYRPNEKIHSLLSIGSINARMVTSVLVTSAINKGLIELSRHVKEMAGIKWDDNLI